VKNFALALCFAALVALAVGTTAIRANNRELRHRLEEMNTERRGLRVEVERREVLALRKETPEVLAARLRAFWQRQWRD